MMNSTDSSPSAPEGAGPGPSAYGAAPVYNAAPHAQGAPAGAGAGAADDQDELNARREAYTHEHTLHGMNSGPSLLLFVLLLLAAILLSIGFASDSWFQSSQDLVSEHDIRTYGIFDRCDENHCSSHHHTCVDITPRNAFCADINYAKGAAQSTVGTAWVTVVLALINYVKARKAPERRPVLRMVVFGGLVSSIVASAADTLQFMFGTRKDTRNADDENTFDVDWGVDAWVVGASFAVAAAVLMLVLLVGCGRAKAPAWVTNEKCCYGLRRPRHPLAHNARGGHAVLA